MAITPGTRVGVYEIGSLLGVGGMGEVYRARDPRIGRDVAIKVLHPDALGDQGRLQRFEIEARAVGALSHPNLLVLFDVGSRDGTPYIVTELLEGESLRQLLQRGPLPVREAIDIAAQAARGLAAAHAKGIVHRDLKPVNLFILPDRRVKILDFGLAKLIAAQEVEGATRSGVTETGQALGTVGYMAPEQVSGGVVTPATDLFALGAVLYEMLSGDRAFKGSTTVDTLRAILREEPAEFPAASPVSPALEQVMRRCLSKRPEERFQSAGDLAFALEMLSGSRPTQVMPVVRRRRWAMPAAIAGLLALAIAGTAAAVRWLAPPSRAPIFTSITTRRQGVGYARFAPDGQTIIFGATYQENDRHELFSARVGSADARSFGLPADVFAVSATGELALKTGPAIGPGTLARMPLEGGTPREVLKDVLSAAWSPTGDLAVIHLVNGRYRLEYPIGTVRAESDLMAGPSISPTDARIAFVMRFNDRPTLHVVEATAAGAPRPIWQFPKAPHGLCWGDGGKAIWYMLPGNGVSELRAVDTNGRDRWLLTLPGAYVLHDCRADGGALVERMNTSDEIALLPGDGEQRDLSWLNNSTVSDLSADGAVMLFAEGTAPAFSAYLRRTDGSPAVRLGDGYPDALSPDGQLVIVGLPTEHVLLPTGPGQPRHLSLGSVRRATASGAWLPDGKRIVFLGAEPGRSPRCFVQALDGEPTAVTAEGTAECRLPSPDGRSLFVSRTTVFDLEGQTSRPIPGLTEEDLPIGWSADGSAVFVAVAPSAAARRLFRVDVRSGKRTFVRDLRATGPIGGGAGGIREIHLSADARTIAYTVSRYSSELMLIEGLR